MEANTNTNAYVLAKNQTLPLVHDYRNALIVGLISAIFLLPTLHQLQPAGKLAFLLNSSLTIPILIFGLPVLCLGGIFAGKILFQRIQGFWQFVKFALIGASNTVINFGILNFLSGLTGVSKGFEVAIFGAIAFIGATTNSYIWNAHWSFQNDQYRTAEELVKFLSVSITGLLLNSLIIYLATTLYHPGTGRAEIWLNLANLSATVVTLVWNFIGYKFFVFNFNSSQK